MISRDGIQALLECFPLVAHKLVDLTSERSKNFLLRMEMLEFSRATRTSSCQAQFNTYNQHGKQSATVPMER
jgi:hypothetical protein